MRIVLVCYSGSSASILRDRMLSWAHANLVETEIIISSIAGLDDDKEDADIVLVGPQVRCACKYQGESAGEDYGAGSGYP